MYGVEGNCSVNAEQPTMAESRTANTLYEKGLLAWVVVAPGDYLYSIALAFRLPILTSCPSRGLGRSRIDVLCVGMADP